MSADSPDRSGRTRTPSAFPRRDAEGRIAHPADLLAIAFAGTLLGLAAVAVVDGVFALLGSGRFGGASGWLAAVLPFLLLTEEFRAWRPLRGRAAVAFGAAAVGLALGVLVSYPTRGLPPLVSGALGAVVAVLAYATVWFFGVRRLR
jgi:hypothetical protein